MTQSVLDQTPSAERTTQTRRWSEAVDYALASNLKYSVAVLAVLALAVVLRVFQLGTQSLWLDEVTSIVNSSQSLFHIITAKKFDSHTPPLYYLLLNMWFEYFPRTEIGLRGFSVACDVLAIGVVIGVFTRQFGRSVGLLVALLHAISPYAICFAQEGRMYSLNLLLSVALYGLFWTIATCKATALTYVALTFIAILGMYTHYYFAFILAGLSLAAAVYRHRAGVSLSSLCAAMTITGLAYVPWIEVIIGLLQSEGQQFRQFVFTTIPYTFFRFTAGYAIFPINFGDKERFGQTVLQNTPSIFATFAIGGLTVGLGLLQLARRYRPLTAFIAFYALSPIVLALAACLISNILSERYLIVIFPAFLTLAALGIFYSRPIVGVLFFTLQAVAVWQYFNNENFGKTQWRQFTARAMEEVIGEPAKRCRTAVANPEFVHPVLAYYLSADWEIFRIHQKTEVVANIVEGRACKGLWLFERGMRVSDEEYFLAQGARLEESYSSNIENGLAVRYFSWEQPR